MLVNVRDMKSPSKRPRRGATVVEFAVIAPVALLLLIGFAVLAMGVYRYQQVAWLAREGARYASTHGAQYRADHRLPVGDATLWSQEIRDNWILPFSTALDASRLSVSASYSAGNNRANASNSETGFGSTIDNTVTLTVSYEWVPEGFLTSPLTLTSTASAPMAY
jgi:Flp pilus assembly protein TadG